MSEPLPEERKYLNTAEFNCRGVRKRLVVRITELRRTVQTYPTALIIPLLLLGLLLGLGIWGVTRVALADQESVKVRATGLAKDTALWYSQQLSLAVLPVSLTAAIVRYNPDYGEASKLFRSLAPTLLAQVPRNAAENIQLVPHGVVSDVFPAAGNEAAVGFNLFNSTTDREGAVKTVQDRAITMVGPLEFVQGGQGVIVREPIFVAADSSDDSFGIPGPTDPFCGAPCEYNSTTKTAFWGFAAALVSTRYLNSSDSRLADLHSRGFWYEVLVPNAATGDLEVAFSSCRERLPPEAVEVAVPMPNTEWVLRVYPHGGWAPAWFGGLLAGVILLAIALSALMFAVLVSRRRHQLLLNALLPKDIIRELRMDATATTTPMEARILRAETPADLLLKMMSDLLEGHSPDLRDVVFIRTALMRNMDIYQPLNLQGYLRGSSLDVDVVNALMQQLGTLRNSDVGFSSGVGSGGGGEDASGDRCTDLRDSHRNNPSQSAACCDTVSGALQLVLSVPPCIPSTYNNINNNSIYSNNSNHAALAADGAAEAAFLPQQLSAVRDSESGNAGVAGGSGAGAGAAAGAVADLAERISCGTGRWRGRKTPAMFLSTNGRPSGGQLPLPLPQPQPQVTVPASVIEEAERLLARADDWQFDTWALQEATQGHALSALGFYLLQREGLIGRFRIHAVKLARLLRTLESGYLDNPYHNATHAADVLQTLHVLVHAAQLNVHYLDPLGLLAAYYAAIVHDYAHPGLTNDFLIATCDPLAVRYNDRSPLENHHCAASFALLQRPELDALAPLSQTERAAFRKQVIELVLATDMKQHFSILSHFNTVHRLSAYSQQQQQQQQQQQLQQPQSPGSGPALASSNSLPRSTSMRPNGTANGAANGIDRLGTLPRSSPHPLQHLTAPKPSDDTERLLSLQVALKCADIGHLGEALEVHKRWLGVLEEEFFRQGDRERELGLPISPLFDRAKQGVSKSQVGFYDFVALPLVHALSTAFPGAQPLMRCFLSNYNHWRLADGQPPVELPRARMPSIGSGRPGAPALTVSTSDRAITMMRSLSRGLLGTSASAHAEGSKAQASSLPVTPSSEPPTVKLSLS